MERGVRKVSTRKLILFACVLGMGAAALALTSCALFNKPPIAGFTVGPSTTGAAPFTVTLSGAASTDPDAPDGEVKTYAWDFGDGSTGSGKSVVHTYSAAGTYTIILTVTDEWDASDHAAKTIYVTAAAPAGPTASFTASPSSGTSPLSVTLDASVSSYAGGTITAYEWTFGDGGNGFGQVTSHTYYSSSSQTYTVTLLVRTSDGKTGTATKTISVSPTGGGGTPTAGSPSARFDVTPTVGVAPLYVLFDPKDSEADAGRTLTNYVWSFGDGESGYSVNPTVVTHTYVTAKASEVFSAMLLVLDNENADDSITKTIKAYNSQPVAGFEIANPPGGDPSDTGVVEYTAAPADNSRWVADDVFYGDLGTATRTVRVWIRSKAIPDARWFDLATPTDAAAPTLQEKQAQLRTATGSALSSTTSKPTGYVDHNFSYDPEGQGWTTALPAWFYGNQSWGIKQVSIDWGEGAPVEENYAGTEGVDFTASHVYTFSPGGVSTAVPREITITVRDYLGAKASWTRTVWLKSGEEAVGEI
ncbi:MAG: PKD domain-containing protein [Candidatus Bipolaricaulota bacterium]|nr:PKD domain-containing protein [Candidatus Bipolaricaulota bacterium]